MEGIEFSSEAEAVEDEEKELELGEDNEITPRTLSESPGISIHIIAGSQTQEQ